MRKSKELKALQLEWNTIDKGKVQHKAARRNLRKLKEKELGKFLEKNSREITLQGKHRLLGAGFNLAMITLPFPAMDVF